MCVADAEHSLLRTEFRASNVASDAPHLTTSMLAVNDVDMVDSVVMRVRFMLGGYCHIVHVAD